MRVFGCVGYAKVTTPHLRKLDDRSRALVHLGTEPGTKAYRLLDPTTRRIVVSRDVVFNEEQRWKWIQEQKEVDTSVITFGYPETGLCDQAIIKEEETDPELEDEESDHEEEPVVLRRSSRTINKPSYCVKKMRCMKHFAS